MIETLEYARRYWYANARLSETCDYPDDSPVMHIGPSAHESILDESNRDSILTRMGGFSESDWQHDGSLLIARADTEAAAELRRIEKDLSDYPVLDDDDFCERERNAWNDAFENEWCNAWLRTMPESLIAAIKREVASGMTEYGGYDLDNNYPHPLAYLHEHYPWALEPEEPTLEETLSDTGSTVLNDARAVIAACHDKYHAIDLATLMLEELNV